jgi:hypothetical protein
MNRRRTTRAAHCLLLALTIPVPADQQVIYPPSAMPYLTSHENFLRLIK